MSIPLPNRRNAIGMLAINLVWGFTSNQALAQDSAWYVPDEIPTIQGAIDAASPGDTIFVSPGRYVENLTFPDNANLSLQSTDPLDWGVVRSTIIDGGGQGPVITLPDHAIDVSIWGFTVTNGLNEGPGSVHGGGITGTRHPNLYDEVHLSQMIITGNCVRTLGLEPGAEAVGGGIADLGGRLSRVFITDNVAEAVATEHHAIARGGGISGCGGGIWDTVVIGNNTARVISGEGPTPGLSRGGGMDNCRMEMWNCVVVHNSAGTIGGISSGEVTVLNCIVWGNDPPIMENQYPPFACCIEDPSVTGFAVIHQDPQFVHPAANDYHIAPTSPCIDAGTPGTHWLDTDGDSRGFDGTSEPRFEGSNTDIGVDEYTGIIDSHVIGHLLGTITLSGEYLETADANDDSVVDISDAVALQASGNE